MTCSIRPLAFVDCALIVSVKKKSQKSGGIGVPCGIESSGVKVKTRCDGEVPPPGLFVLTVPGQFVVMVASPSYDMTGPSLVQCGNGPGGSTHDRSKPKLVTLSTFSGPPVMVPAPSCISTMSWSPTLLMGIEFGYEILMKPLHSSVARAGAAVSSATTPSASVPLFRTSNRILVLIALSSHC